MFPSLLLLAACAPDNKVSQVYPNLTVVPEFLDFGEVVEDYGSTLEVQLVNGGLARLDVSAVTIEGADADAFAPGALPESIPKDETGTVSVTFTPPQQTDYAAVLVIESNDPDTPRAEIPLTGTGVDAPTPDIDLDTLNVDFGTVGVGSVGTSTVMVTNAGDGTLTIGDVRNEGSGAFRLANDMDGQTILSGQTVPLVVTYNPTTDLGDNGTVTIESDDPDEPSLTVILLGNGGGDYEYPVAVISGPASVAPRETVILDGSGSYDPGGFEPLVYAWTLTTVPDGSGAGESFLEETETAYFVTDLAGIYEVELQVTNTMGLQSVPAVWTGDAIPDELLHVELTWNTGGADLDLHLANSAGEFYIDPDDANWCNPSPDWGASGSTDDPRLDIDDLYGYGPENINIDEPAADTYMVRVHYFIENGDGDVTATVKVYTYGELVGTYSKVLERNDLWDVAEVRFPDGASVELDQALYDAPRRMCE